MPDGLMEIALIVFSARECWCPLCVCVCGRVDQRHITGRYISAFQKVGEPDVGFPGEGAIRALWFIER